MPNADGEEWNASRGIGDWKARLEKYNEWAEHASGSSSDDDGHEAIPHKDSLRKRPAEEVAVVAAAKVFGDEPGLESRVEKGGRHTTQQPPTQQHGKRGRVLGEASERVRGDVREGRLFAAGFVGERADDRAEEHGGTKPRDEEAPNAPRSKP